MMSIQRISLILPTEYLEDCERCLRAAGVPGMTIDSVRGLGGHANYFSSDLLRSNVRIEMYVGAERCKELCETIRDFALGLPVKGGILVVETVDRMISLENGLELTAEML
jgi:nitrogen regulatory protein PII